MARRTRLALPQQVCVVRKQIDFWRGTKRRRTLPMPSDLWGAAADLARTHGVYAIASALGLSYNSLKRHAELRGSARSRLAVPATPFVELLPSPPLLAAEAIGDSVEICSAGGDKLSVHLAAGNRLDVVALAAAFVGRA